MTLTLALMQDDPAKSCGRKSKKKIKNERGDDYICWAIEICWVLHYLLAGSSWTDAIVLLSNTGAMIL